MIKVKKTGLIYRNPMPHVHSEHAYFPSVATLASGRMLASLVIGEAFESVNCRTHIAHSDDAGDTWKMHGPVYGGTRGRQTSDASRLTALPGGDAVLLMIRADRSAHPGYGLVNPKTMGFVPTELLTFRSRNNGKNWTAPKPMRAPLRGPEFELCSPITMLRNELWIWPTSTWNDWAGRFGPEGRRMVAFVSRDQGRTWPEYWRVMADNKQNCRFWESKIVELPDGRLLASAWVYDESKGRDLPNHFTYSDDDGQTWSKPAGMGLVGQTLTPWVLNDGRILCVYRRTDKPGFWAALCSLEKNKWKVREQAPIWGAGAAGLTSHKRSMAHNFAVLRFGAPCVCLAPDKSIFVSFWCYEDCVSNVRWFKLAVK